MASIEVDMSELYEVIETVFEKNQSVILKVRGNSMYPLMRDRIDSFKLVKILRSPRKKEIVLFLRDDGKFILHRIIKIKKGKYYITGDNQHCLEEVESRQIKGRVIVVYRGSKSIDCERSFKYRLYVQLWCTSLFMRRVMLKILRLFKRPKNHIPKQN